MTTHDTTRDLIRPIITRNADPKHYGTDDPLEMGRIDAAGGDAHVLFDTLLDTAAETVAFTVVPVTEEALKENGA